VVTLLARVRIRSDEEVQALEAAERQQVEARLKQSQFQHQDAGGYSADEEAAQVEAAQLQRDEPKIGRNDPCPCGSGKKYKHCHGQLS
jgi:preprotein translocase subunit SecA